MGRLTTAHKSCSRSFSFTLFVISRLFFHFYLTNNKVLKFTVVPTTLLELFSHFLNKDVFKTNPILHKHRLMLLQKLKKKQVSNEYVACLYCQWPQRADWCWRGGQVNCWSVDPEWPLLVSWLGKVPARWRCGWRVFPPPPPPYYHLYIYIYIPKCWLL